MTIVDHHQRITRRENYLNVAISRRDSFSASGRNIVDGFALEDLCRGVAVAAMVGAILLDFVCNFEV